MSEVTISKIILQKDGVEYVARPATEEEKKNAYDTAGINLNCECGQELCVDGWLWRCMASGGGTCIWYITDIVC